MFTSIFFSRRMATVLVLGFSSGIPLALTGSTLQAWMTTENIDLKTIGLFSLVGLPYVWKFLWAPLMDRFSIPFLGRRQGWILICQIMLFLAIASMGAIDPKAHIGQLAVMALLVAFFSASQDIVVDAYRTDLLRPEEVGPGASLYVTGYRIAMLVSGALSLILADHLPWRVVYLIMASTMGLGILATFFAPQPRDDIKPPSSLKEAIVGPFMEFFRRKGAFEVLGFITLYKLDVVMATALMTVFIMKMGFSKTDIGVVTKGFGLFATIIGTLTGGALMVRLGMKRSLWTFGIAQGLSGLSFLGLAILGHNYPMMVTAIAAENFFSGMGNAAYAGFLMSLCDKRFTAFQFALLTSLMATSRVILSAPCGYLAEVMGWPLYFLVATFLMIPSLLLLLRFDKWTRPQVS